MATLAAALALLTGSLPGPAEAGSAPSAGSAESRTAQVTAGAMTVTPTLKLLGLDLSTLTRSVTTALVNPLLQLPVQLSTSLANNLTGAGLRATNPGTQQPRPASGYPTCGQQGWTSDSCYGPVLPTIAAPPLLTLTTGGLQGYATGDKDGYVAAAHAANPIISLFGMSIGDLGVVDSTSSCTTTTCTAGHTLTGGSLFAGNLTFGLAGTNFLAKVGNTAVTGTPITVVNGVTAALNNNLLTVTIQLTLTQLLGAIGTTLSSLDGALGSLFGDNGTTASLTLTIGPGSVTSSGGSQSSAWGLEVGVGLNANIKLSVGALLNLSTIEVAVGGDQPNLTALKLAYSTTTAGPLPPGWVPPALI